MPTSSSNAPVLNHLYRVRSALTQASAATAAAIRTFEFLDAGSPAPLSHINVLFAVVAKAHGITPEDMVSHTRAQPLVTARHTAAYVAHELLPNLPPEDLASALGLAPASLRYALRSVRDRISVDTDYSTNLQGLIDQCRTALGDAAR